MFEKCFFKLIKKLKKKINMVISIPKKGWEAVQIGSKNEVQWQEKIPNV